MSINGPKWHWGIPSSCLCMRIAEPSSLHHQHHQPLCVPLQLHPPLSSVWMRWIWVASSHTGGSPSYMSAVQCIPARMRLLTLLSCLIGEQNPSNWIPCCPLTGWELITEKNSARQPQSYLLASYLFIRALTVLLEFLIIGLIKIHGK